MNISGVQLPSPVALSEVRFIAKLTPHGPAHAPRWLLATVPHLPAPMTPFGTGGSLSIEGFPDSSLLISGSGPFGPNFFGVWQSLHPPTSVRYLPRSTGDWVGAAAAETAGFVSDAGGVLLVQPAANTSTGISPANPRMNCIASPSCCLMCRAFPTYLEGN